MFTSLSSLSHREQPIHPRAFLFRVATNHWIDQCRKRKIIFEEWQEARTASAEPEVGLSLEIRDAFETLLAFLPPRQTVIVVLVDAFQFSTREAAEILGTTEGAVHAALFRARTNLRRMAMDGVEARRMNPDSASKPDPALVERYVSCFNSRNFQGIADLLADNAVYSFVAQSSKEYGKHTIMNASHHPRHYEREDLKALTMTLWGKQVVALCIVARDGTPVALDEVIAIETEDNLIVRMNGYYFCPQLMNLAALEWGLKRNEPNGA